MIYQYTLLKVIIAIILKIIKAIRLIVIVADGIPYYDIIASSAGAGRGCRAVWSARGSR